MSQSILDRVQKLLKMAADTSSPNEAVIAASRARTLMDKHQIKEMDFKQDQDQNHNHIFQEKIFSPGTKNLMVPVSMLMAAISKLNDCRVRVVVGSNKNKDIKFSGLENDVLCAIEMTDYLMKGMYAQAERNEISRANRSSYRKGFAMGVADKIEEVMVDRSQLKLSNNQSLVVCKNQLVTEQFGAPRYKKVKTILAKGSYESYAKGMTAGRNTDLNRQIEKR